METTPPPLPDSSSPRSPNDGGNLRRTPWAQVVVRGAGETSSMADSAPIAVPSSPEKAAPAPENVPVGEGSDKGEGGNVGGKPAWNKPSNGVSTAVVAISGVAAATSSSSDQGSGSGASAAAVVMGASAWPALSESTRHPQKSVSTDSPKSGSESVPVSQGPVVTTSSQEPKQGSANANHNSGTHSAAPARHRMTRRGGGGGGNRQGGFARGASGPPMPPVFPVPEMTQNSFSSMAPMTDSSSRETRPAGGYDHSSHRGSNRRGNFGHHNRGDGRNSYRGGRRDQEHGNHNWSSAHRPHRDTHGHPHMPPPRGFITPPVQGAPPVALSPMYTPYGNTMVYPDMPPPVFYYPMPPPYFPNAPPSPYVYMPESPLHLSIVKQIDYYFSDANLVKDVYLRNEMDKDGWVPVHIISSFPRVKSLTDSNTLILNCLRQFSSVVEVQGDKIRRRDDWMKWIPHSRSSSDSGVQSLINNVQKVSLEEVNHDQTLKEESIGQLQVTNAEGSDQGIC